MPRTKRQTLSYFPLDTDFLHTKHIKALRREYGPVGILTYLSILCRVYGTGGYYYTFHDCKSLCMDIAEEVANYNLPTVSKYIDGALHFLVEHKIFDEKLFLQNVITGKSLQEQFIISTHKWRRRLKMDAYLLVDVHEVLQENGYSVTEALENVTNSEVSDTEGTQRKGKERKEKEKGKETFTLSLHAAGAGESDRPKDAKDSFDTDDFARIAMENSMMLARKKGEDSNGTI